MTTDAPGSGAGPGALRLTRWTVSSGSNVQSRAAVIVEASGHVWQASATGNGAIDALLEAVDAALAPILGGVARITSYDVHALAEGPDAEGVVTVVVRPPDSAAGERSSGDYAASVRSTNIIAASIEAYIEAIGAMLADVAWHGAVATAGAKATQARGSGPARGARAELDKDAPTDTTSWFDR